MFAQNRVLSNAAFASAVVLATFAGSPLALGQVGGAAQAPKADAAAPAPAVATTSITVIAVSGKVQFKSDTGANLADLKPGQRLDQGAEILVGINSIVQIKIGEGQVFTIDRLSRVLIKDAIKAAADGKNTTVLQLPYGRIRFDVTSTKVANSVTIQTPDATLAVKGTHGVIEKIPGQPTRAYGGELNSGIFNVMYAGGVNVDVGKDHRTTGDHVQTAAAADADTFVQTADEHSVDETSRQSAGWTPSVGGVKDARTIAGRYLKKFFPPETGPHGENPIGDDGYVSVDHRGGATVTLFGLDGKPTTIGVGLSGFFGTPQGAALVMTTEGPAIVAIDQTAGPGHASGTLALRQWNPGLKRWTFLGKLSPIDVWVSDGEGSGHFVQSGYELDGLGNLGGTLYASGVNPLASQDPSESTGNFGVFELMYPSLNGGSFRAQQMMSFPMLSAGGGMTGANSRGSMFVAAQFNLATGQVPGMVLLEVDPRSNYIANVWSVADGDFTGANGQISSSFQPSGVAFVNGQVVLTGTDGNHSATYTVRPSDLNQPRPQITSMAIGPTPNASHALAGEGGFATSAPLPLGQADRPLTPIPGVDPLWLGASYSRSTAASPAFRRMVRDTVLSLASSPAECAQSTTLDTSLGNAIGDHYNQMGGVNAALNQFYSTLPPNHPCGCGRPRALPGR